MRNPAKWPSELRGEKVKNRLLLRRERLDPDFVWGRCMEPRYLVAPSSFDPAPRIDLLSAVEAKQIRDNCDGAFFLDPNQQPVQIEIPNPDHYIERRVECYSLKIPDKECGLPYLEEPERVVQILAAREVKNRKVVREWEEDHEDVPLWHLINLGCLGSSDWRSKFAEYIPPR